jgi:hypothetical protein
MILVKLGLGKSIKTYTKQITDQANREVASLLLVIFSLAGPTTVLWIIAFSGYSFIVRFYNLL